MSNLRRTTQNKPSFTTPTSSLGVMKLRWASLAALFRLSCSLSADRYASIECVCPAGRAPIHRVFIQTPTGQSGCSVHGGFYRERAGLSVKLPEQPKRSGGLFPNVQRSVLGKRRISGALSMMPNPASEATALKRVPQFERYAVQTWYCQSG